MTTSKLMQPLHDESVLWFGKFKGYPLTYVPSDYYRWLFDQPNAERNFPELATYLMLRSGDMPVTKAFAEAHASAEQKLFELD